MPIKKQRHVHYDGTDLQVFSVVYRTLDGKFISTVLVAYDDSEAMRNAIIRMEFVPGAHRVDSLGCVGTLYELLTCRKAIPLLQLHTWSQLLEVESCR